MDRLKDRVAWITGAACGIGRGIAHEYAREGALLGLCDLDEERLASVEAELRANGVVVRTFIADVSSEEQMRSIRDRLVSQFGRLDILVNNAGIVMAGPVHETSLEHWRKVIAVDLEAVYIGSKLAAEAMIPRRSGRIINIASIQAFMTTGNVGSYNAAKAGVVGLTHSMAYELGPYGILVNAIAPGAIRTGMSGHPDDAEADDTEEDRKAGYMGRIPLGRNGKPSDIAGAALFLASDDCRYITGHTLVVDGGYSIALSEARPPSD